MAEKKKLDELLSQFAHRNATASTAFASEDEFRRKFHDRLRAKSQREAMVGTIAQTIVLVLCLVGAVAFGVRKFPSPAFAALSMDNAHAGISYAHYSMGLARRQLCLKVTSPTGECLEKLVFSISDNDYISFSSKILEGRLFAGHLSCTSPCLELTLDIKESEEQSLHWQQTLPFPDTHLEEICGGYRISLENLSTPAPPKGTHKTKNAV